MAESTLSNLLDRIATLNYNVIRVLNEHPLLAHKYLNGGTVRLVISPYLQKIFTTKDDEKSIARELKAQFRGRLCDQDVGQLGYFNYKNVNFSWLIQAVKRDDESLLSDDIFDTKNNIYWVIVSTAFGLRKFNRNRIQQIKKVKKI
jgi:hypothetical protein